jgi:hypothetical protein
MERRPYEGMTVGQSCVVIVIALIVWVIVLRWETH